jgi:hypothetical protein
MAALTLEQFSIGWNVLLDTYKTQQQDTTIAFQYQALINQDPELTADQFAYAVQQCMLSCTFMPKLNELLRQIYEPNYAGGPCMPDIDPKYADEYQLSAFYKAQHLRNKWEAEHDRVPAIGHFRSDRLNEIPGIPDADRRLGYYRRPDQGVLAGLNESLPSSRFSPHEHEMEIERRKRQMLKDLKEAV